MKRLLSLMLAMMMIFALASCEGGFLGSSKDPSELTLDLSHLGAETLQGMTQKDILKQIDKYEPTGQIIQGSTTAQMATLSAAGQTVLLTQKSNSL